MPNSFRLLVLLLFALVNAAPAHAVIGKPLFGMQTGINWTYAKFADNGGRMGMPNLGFHALIPLNRRFRVHAYLEGQNFKFQNPETLFEGGLGNRAYSLLVVPTVQFLTPPLGSVYVGAGAGIGLNSSFNQTVPWTTAVWGVHLNRLSFVEFRGQFDLSRNLLDNIYFAGIVGFHFNPREATWKEADSGR